MADMDHSGSGFNRGSALEYPAPIHRPMEISHTSIFSFALFIVGSLLEN